MNPKEHIEWFYEKFKNGLEGHHSSKAIEREKRDQEAILELIELYKCESVLEIGTWEGQTGLLLWLYPKVKKFVAIDIHKDMNIEFKNDVHIVNEVEKEFIGHYLKDTNTKLYFIDTMKWEPEEWQKEVGPIDLVFIDGNHNFAHVKNDTLKALKINPKVIVWHDVDHLDDNDQVPYFLSVFMEDNPQYSIQKINKTEIGYLVL